MKQEKEKKYGKKESSKFSKTQQGGLKKRFN